MPPLLKLFKEQVSGGIEKASHFEGCKEKDILAGSVG